MVSPLPLRPFSDLPLHAPVSFWFPIRSVFVAAILRSLRSSPLPASREIQLSPDCPLIAFRSSPESLQLWRRRHAVLPFRSAGPAAFLAVPSPSTFSRSWTATYLPGLPNLRVTVPPQRFARSRGLHPSTPCRPCSMPVPSLGFCPSGSLPTRGAFLRILSVGTWYPLGYLCPLAVSALALPRFQFARLNQLSGKGLAFARRADRPRPTFAKPRVSKPALLQGFAPRERPYLHQAV